MTSSADDLPSPADRTRPAGGGKRLPLAPFGPRDKVSLIVEVLGDYLVLLRTLRETDVLQMAARARRVRTRERVMDSRQHLVARRLGKVVGKILGVLPTDSRCLIRSLVLVRVLARRSIPTVLVIGVTKLTEFKAHAWVEHDGIPILPAGEYTRLTEL